MQDKGNRFLCGTLCLLPLMWTRVGHRGIGLTEDDGKHQQGFPKSIWGQFSNPTPKGIAFECNHYSELTSTGTRRTRKVMLALIPTWGVHVFAQSKFSQYKKAMEYLLGLRPPNPFSVELGRECARSSDVELAELPLADLQNKAVLDRDAGICHNRFPCAFQDPE